MTAPTTEAHTPKKITLQLLREFTGTLFVRNETLNTITHNTLDKSQPPFILGAKGSDDSVQVLPKWVAEAPGFQRVWLRKLVTISDDPEMENEIVFQAEKRTLAQAASVNQTQAVIEQPSSARTMVEAQCLISGERVFMTEKDVKEQKPPLAERFQSRAHEFVPTEVSDGANGGKLVWSHPSGPITE